MKSIVGIMAATKEGVIGYKNELPWDYPDELEHFKNTTQNHPIIMGCKTYHATAKELFKSRQAIVLSRNTSLKLDDAIVFHTLEELLNFLPNSKVFMIGGGEISGLFLEKNLLSSFILTEIKENYFGDSYLPLNYLKEWPKTIQQDTSFYTIYNLVNPKEKILCNL